jgi:hypothetical protein
MQMADDRQAGRRRRQHSSGGDIAALLGLGDEDGNEEEGHDGEDERRARQSNQ